MVLQISSFNASFEYRSNMFHLSFLMCLFYDLQEFTQEQQLLRDREAAMQQEAEPGQISFFPSNFRKSVMKSSAKSAEDEKSNKRNSKSGASVKNAIAPPVPTTPSKSSTGKRNRNLTRSFENEIESSNTTTAATTGGSMTSAAGAGGARTAGSFTTTLSSFSGKLGSFAETTIGTANRRGSASNANSGAIAAAMEAAAMAINTTINPQSKKSNTSGQMKTSNLSRYETLGKGNNTLLFALLFIRCLCVCCEPNLTTKCVMC